MNPVRFSWGTNAAEWAVLVHGGAGDVPQELADRHIAGCRAAAQAAAEALRTGGMALDAAQRAVAALEDDPCFNAGTGACLNADGQIELDAAIMDGERLRAGAVGALPPFAHPIAIARAVLDVGRHVLYVGAGAARFAMEHGFVASTTEAMTTSAARARWKAFNIRHLPDDWTGGTVGAVARDRYGTVAAATSTGGLTNKPPGRVGDSPILGAGTYADNVTGACSFTGFGEAAMRIAFAKTATDAMGGGAMPQLAAANVIHALAARVNATGGAILVDNLGRLGCARNAPSMSWAAASGRCDLTSGI
jgi:beta-aspartyl-peptidase (threonine type)